MPEAVLAAQNEYDGKVRANVARGVHDWAERATEAYENARATVASFLHSAPAQVVFTSGATAALNFLAYALSAQLGPGDVIAASVAEHHSNLVPWQLAARRCGAAFVLLGLDAEGAPDIEKIPELNQHGRVRVLALTHASNVTGVPTNLERAAVLARELGCAVVADGAQMMPHGPLAQAPPTDYYVFAGHKCHGPTGIGVLWTKLGGLANLEPPFAGGGAMATVDSQRASWQPPPQCWEAGTPPISQAVGLAAALTWLARLDRALIAAEQRVLTTQLLAGLANLPVELVGPVASMTRRLPLVSFTVAGCHPHDVCQILAAEQVAVRGGHHCAQPLIAALGLTSAGCVRASLGPHSTAEDIDRLLAGLRRVRRELC